MMVTLSTVSAFLPQVLVSLFAGVWADRYDRKRLIILADGLIAAATLVPALVFLADYGSMPMIFAVSAVRSLGMAIFGPLADVMPIETLMLVTGALLFLQGLGIFRNEIFLREGLRAEVPALQEVHHNGQIK
jgi:DHA3 family macrolide efflux protein-like MFS transporter